jgi:hypothetical protein
MTKKIISKFQVWGSWVNLSKVRNSFLSKATTAFSLATFGLANLAKPLNSIGVDVWRLKLLFIGSVLFLAGYVFLLIRIPPEFRAESDPDSVVDKMLRIQGWQFFQSRLSIIKSIIARYEHLRDLDYVKGPYTYAISQANAADTATIDNWKEYSSSLYHSDLLLRQFDYPISRMIILFLLIVGLILLMIPSLVGVYSAIAHF